MSAARRPTAASRLGWIDLAQLGVGALAAVSVFLPWYGTEAGNPNSIIEGERGELSAWQVHPVLRWILIAAAIATLFGAWQTIRAQRTELPRGLITVIVAIFLTGLVVFAGLIQRPGEPSGTISLEYGWFIALASGLAAVAAGLLRHPPPPRQPPGV